MSSIKIVLCAITMFGIVSSALARVPVPTEPYGSPAEQQQCINNKEASLHGQSPLGSRNGPEYIQDLGELYSLGMTEYDVLVDRCREQLYHQYVRAHGGTVQ
jgi:hypothetical protein